MNGEKYIRAVTHPQRQGRRLQVPVQLQGLPQRRRVL